MYEIMTGEQLLRFEGVLLGESTSEAFVRSDPTRKPRWHEVRIYRTTDGRYIVEKVGGSAVEGETPRGSAHVADTARGAVESLYTSDADGIAFITYVAREAARAASNKDPEFSTAYHVRDLSIS